MKPDYTRIILMNAANMPHDGTYIKRSISKNQFKSIVQGAKTIISSIGYESITKLILELTGVKVSVNRSITLLSDNDIVLGLNLDYRMNPDDKGRKEPNIDDYIFFITFYKKT